MFIFQTYLVVWSVWHFCFLLIKLWKYCLLQIDQIITVESAQREQQHPLPIAHLASIFYYEITVHEFASLHLCHSHQLGIATSIEWSNDWLIDEAEVDGIKRTGSLSSRSNLWGSANLGYKNLQSFWPVPSQLWFDIFSCYLSLIPNLHILLRSIPLTFLTGKLFQWDSKWGDDPYE